MTFEYSCFISFRHTPGELSERFISDLASALREELMILTGKDLFIDYDRLRGGDLLPSSIASALCKSLCMVVVYVPRYFDDDHTYCAREYRAMEELEKARLNALGTNAGNHGLIIPVVFRGLRNLPGTFKDRLYHDFESFSLLDRRLSKHPKYQPKVRQIAEYIYDRWEAMKTVPDLGTNCDEFSLPSDDSVRQWMGQVQGTVAGFPLRQS